MIYWIVLLTSCVLLTVLGTLGGKRPLFAAIGVSLLAGICVGLYGARTAPLWLIGSVVVIVCSLPVTIVTGIVTENLMDKHASRSKD